MNLFHLAYNTLGIGCAAFLMPFFWLHQHKKGNLDYFYQRLGFYPQWLKQWFKGHPRLWMHAASVGEVGAALAIMRHLNTELPSGQLALSVTTEPGLAQARAIAGHWAACFSAPVDLNWSNRRALSMVRPNALVLLETEIWPNLISAAHEMGVPIVIANGRISVRTIKYYRKMKPFMRYILAQVDRFSMISTRDAERIESLGAPADRIAVNGNAKFDAIASPTDPDLIAQAVNLYNLNPEIPVFVAGSTRFPEEQMLLDAYASIRRSFPETVMIIAPRHLKRVDQIEAWVRERGLGCQRRSQLDVVGHPRTAPVVILDTIGELAATYSVAAFVFCGGSLIPKGGQNLLEPAVWAKPVICGPSMEDFAEAYQCIASGGGCVTVQDSNALAGLAVNWLRKPDEAHAIGLSARNAVARHRGAASRHAAVIDEFLSA